MGNFEAAVRKKRILIVEDDAATAQVYSWRLEKEGYEVTIVADGSEAFFTANSQVFDLILLDIMLPQMDGLSILKRLRAQKRFQALPIAIFTNASLHLVVPEARKAGANCVFQKAATAPGRIVDAIKELLAEPEPDFKPEQPLAAEAKAQTDVERPARSLADFLAADDTFSASNGGQGVDFRLAVESPAPQPKLRLAQEEPDAEAEAKEPADAPPAKKDKARVVDIVTSFFRRPQKAEPPTQPA